MADVVVKVLTAATSFAFMTISEVKTALGIPLSDTSTSDATLQFMIDSASAEISTKCNRVFAREKVRETWRCLGDPCDCPDGATSRRVHLMHWPVKEADIESVASNGTVVGSGDYELEEQSGKLSLLSAIGEPIVVTYTGGFLLPSNAPNDLKHATALLVRTARMQNAISVTSGSGIRQIMHKHARVSYFSPKDLVVFPPGLAAAGAGGRDPVDSLLSHYTRLWA